MGKRSNDIDHLNTFSSALAGLVAEGLIWPGERKSDRLFSCQPRASWTIISKRLSVDLPGQVWPTGTGLTWICGNFHLWVTATESFPHILKAQAACKILGITGFGDSIGSCARSVLKWIDRPQVYLQNVEQLRAGIVYGFTLCKPGEYASAELWDVQSCYFSLLKRLPSLRLSVVNNRMMFHPMTPDAKSRFGEAVEVVKETKLLRNALVGCMTGKQSEGQFFYRGKRCTMAGRPGAFRGAGLLICRSGWEMCFQAAEETNAVYAATDSVVTCEGKEPKAWNRRGLITRKIASGDAHICAMGIYKVGGKETEWFSRGSRIKSADQMPVKPEKFFIDEWL